MASPSSAVGSNQPWLLGAPITKLIAISTILTFVIFESSKAHSEMAFDTNAIIYHGELYRIISGNLTYSSTGELIIGLLSGITLYRRFEREMGSRKFIVFFIMIWFMSTICVVVIAQLNDDNGIWYSGPYFIFGGCLWLFHQYTPRLHPNFFGFSGLYFSEKSILYAFFIQASTYRGWNTLIPITCGAASACIYVNTYLHRTCDVLLIPNVISNTISSFSERYIFFIDSPPGVMAPRPGGGGGGGGAATRGTGGPRPPRGAQQRQQRPPPATTPFEEFPPPPESSVEQLTNMGFEREAVLRALRESHNNIERAADRLLTGS